MECFEKLEVPKKFLVTSEGGVSGLWLDCKG